MESWNFIFYFKQSCSVNGWATQSFVIDIENECNVAYFQIIYAKKRCYYDYFGPGFRKRWVKTEKFSLF